MQVIPRFKAFMFKRTSLALLPANISVTICSIVYNARNHAQSVAHCANSSKYIVDIINIIHAQRHLTDEEFFPNYIKAHIDRGAVLLDQEQRYGGDFLVHLTELEKGL